ncbi:hypothetical protein [Chromobacterium piscinae]|uniref:hypothetical protein n=1 Tax=Chromobacterium piscinae TaxID=686831 RepID=UPI003208949C
MKSLLTIIATISMTGCALQTYPPYRLYDGNPLDSLSMSTVKVARSFGGPAVYLTYVDGKYVLDYPSMKGYPKDATEANRLEPKTLELQPGKHRFRTNFAYTDLTNKVQTISLLTLIGVSPVSYATFKKSVDMEFTTKPGKTYLLRYTWDESKGAEGVSFVVDECSNDEKDCDQLEASQLNAQAKITPNIPTASELMER